VNVSAANDGPPFKRNADAVFNAGTYANFGVPCFPGATNCFNYTGQQSASPGPVVMRLR
jgi:hypothetical protein